MSRIIDFLVYCQIVTQFSLHQISSKKRIIEYFSSFLKCNNIQLMPALKVNIIIVHPRGVFFQRALARGKTTSQGWTIIMFIASAGINCFIILKLDAIFWGINANISVNEQPEWFHWAHRRWSFYTYLRHVHVLDHGHFTDLDHCFPGPSVKTDDRWNRENKEFRIY